MRYEEFIALNTHMIQKLYKRIEELEKRIDNNQIIYTSNTYLYGISVKIGIGVIGGVTGISEGFLVTVAIGVTVATGLGVGASVRDRFKFCVNTPEWYKKRSNSGACEPWRGLHVLIA